MQPILPRLLAAITRPLHRREVRRAAADWRRDRTDLETRFFDLARRSGKPHGLNWIGCEWTGAVRLVRERETGLLTALAGVVVHFEATEGGEMEEVEAVSLPRDATAVFHYRRGWGTGGRALFNMSPEEAVVRLADQFETVELNPSAGRAI